MKLNINVRISGPRKGTDLRAIQVQVNLNNDRRQKSIGLEVTPNQWDKKRQQVINHHKAAEMNLFIANIKQRLQAAYVNTLNKGIGVSPKYLFERVRLSGDDYSEFLHDFKKWAERKGLSYSLQNLRRSVYRSLKSYQTKNGGLSYKTCDIPWLSRYTRGLVDGTLTGNKLSNVSIRTYIGQIVMFLTAMHLEEMKHDNVEYLLFNKWFAKNYKPIKKKRFALKPGEIQRLKQYKDNKYIKRFLFQYYIGCRYVDLDKIMYSDFYEYKGRMAVSYINTKTGTESTFVLDPEAEEFIKELQAENPMSNQIFERVPDNVYNMKLKQIAKQAGLSRPISYQYANGKEVIHETKPVHDLLSTHIGRYSFGDRYLKLSKNDLRSLQSIFGHSSIETTQAYAKSNRNGALQRQLENL